MAASVDKRRRWWRSPLRWVALLAYGVVMTFASAWGAALLGPAPLLVGWSTAPAMTGRYEWSTGLGRFGMTPLYVRRGPGSGPGASPPPVEAVLPGEVTLVKPLVNVERWVGGMTTIGEVRTYTFGLPVRSMRWWSDFPPPSGMSPGFMWTPDQPIDRHAGLEFAPGTSNTDAKMLPLSVCWGAFLIDVVFWSGSMALGIELTARWRRRRMARIERLRSSCPHCGYSRVGLSEGAVCPECGKGKAT